MRLVDLDLRVRSFGFFLVHVVLYLWARFVVAPARPGSSRVVKSLPLVLVVLFSTALFDVNRPDEMLMALHCISNFLWLTLSKLWSFCMNRGQLVKCYDCGSHSAFALGLLFPVTVAFEEKQRPELENKNAGAYKDAHFQVIRFTVAERLKAAAEIFLTVAAKVGMLAIAGKGYYAFADVGQLLWRDACLGCVVYGITSLNMDVTSFCVLVALNLKLRPSFDCPWLASSIQEMWSRRYNVAIGTSLRDLVYDPICEGRWMKGPMYFRKQTSATAFSRRAFAVFMSFAVSGFLHSALICYSFPVGLPVKYGCFFLACAAVIVMENLVKVCIKQAGYGALVSASVSLWLGRVYAVSTFLYLGHVLCLPELIEAGIAEDMVKSTMSRLGME